MKIKSTRSEKLRDLLRGAHHARENLVVEGQWAQQTLRRIRHLAATGHSASTIWYWEPFFWRWFAAGGVVTVVMALLLLNFQFIPDVDLWSFLTYENEIVNMMQVYLY